MPAKKKETFKPADGKAGMTLTEMQEFIDRCMRADMPLDTPIRAFAVFRSQIYEIWAESKT